MIVAVRLASEWKEDKNMRSKDLLSFVFIFSNSILMKSLEIVLSLVLNHFLFRDWLVGNKNNI